MASSNDEAQFKCECCGYTALSKKAYHRHLKTPKHIINSGQKVVNKQTEMEDKITHITGLLTEMMTAKAQTPAPAPIPVAVAQKAPKEPKVPAIIQKQRNIETFLNERCVNAVNIDDWVGQMQVDFNDYERVGSGYVPGLSTIINRQLVLLDIHNRPLHCTNVAKQTIWVRQNGAWVEDVNNFIITKQIQIISKKISDMINDYRKSKPVRMSDGESIDFHEQMVEILGGKHTRQKNEHDIIKHILPSVAIDARNY